MRREHNVLIAEAEVVGHLRRVPVREQSVGAEVFIYLDKMQLALRLLARPRRARLAVANNAALARNPSGFDQRPQAQNHAGRIAAGVGHEPRTGQLVAIKLRQTVDGFFRQLARRRRQFVPVSKSFRIVEAERAAQVHHADASLQELRDHLERRFMGRSQERRARAAGSDRVHRKCFARGFAPAAQVRENVGQTLHRRRVFAQVKSWLLNSRVPKEQLGELEACIARCSDDGDPLRAVHRSKSSIRFWTVLRA